MIDTTREELLTLAEARTLVPSRVNLSTLYRWCFKGVKGVRLETVCIGGARRTSREALERFFQATTRAADALLVSPTATAEHHPGDVRQVDVDREVSRRGY